MDSADGNTVPLVVTPEEVAEQEEENKNQSRRRTKEEFSWLSLFAFLFLTYNSVTAIYRSLDDLWTVSFVGVSYVDLVLLFLCLRLFEKAPENSSRRGILKFAIWSLATILTAMFSYKVADIMPWPVAVIIWGMGALTVGGGFWGFFIYRDKQ